MLSSYDTYQFSHKSIQEYLAGSYISRYNPLNDLKGDLLNFPIESAMATVLSNNTANFFIEIIELIKTIAANSDRNSRIDAQKKYLELYLEKVCQQKATFAVSEKLGYYILALWNRYYKDTDIRKLPYYSDLFHLIGVRESILLLNETYKPDHGEIIEKELRSDPGYIIKIKRRSASTRSNYDQEYLSVPLYTISNWKYVKVTFDNDILKKQ